MMELRVVSARGLVVSTGTIFAEFVVPRGHVPVTQSRWYLSPSTATTDDHDCIGLRAQEPSSPSACGTTRTAPFHLGNVPSVESHEPFYPHLYTPNNTPILADLATLTRDVIREHPGIPQILFA